MENNDGFLADTTVDSMRSLRCFFEQQMLRNNHAIRYCIKEGCEYCVLLRDENSDFEKVLLLLNKRCIRHGLQVMLLELI